MTSIVNFEERMTTNERLSDVFFASMNRFHDAGRTGARTPNELSKLLILENKFFANQVKNGLKTEEDVENYEKEIPNGKYSCFAYPHKGLDFAHDTIKQTNAVALFSAENYISESNRLRIK